MDTSHHSATPKIIGAFAIVAVTATGAYFFLFKDVSTATNATATSPTSSQTTSSSKTSIDAGSNTTSSDTSNATTTTSSYKDGTYTANATYMVPRGSNGITLQVTIKDGVVTAVDTNHDYSDRESGMYINSFDQSITGKVVGKAITSLTNLSRVGGASLTTYGFDEAIQTVVAQAKV